VDDRVVLRYAKNAVNRQKTKNPNDLLTEGTRSRNSLQDEEKEAHHGEKSEKAGGAWEERATCGKASFSLIWMEVGIKGQGKEK